MHHNTSICATNTHNTLIYNKIQYNQGVRFDTSSNNSMKGIKKLTIVMISRWCMFVLMVGLAVNTANHTLKKTIITSQAISTQSHSNLINAIIHVESRFNDSAIGDGGKAIGCLQIHPVLVREVNRIQPIQYTLEDRWDRGKSIEMFHIILESYRLSKAKAFMDSAEIISRRWNGGPRGDKKKCTEKYWRKVKEQLCKRI